VAQQIIVERRQFEPDLEVLLELRHRERVRPRQTVGLRFQCSEHAHGELPAFAQRPIGEQLGLPHAVAFVHRRDAQTVVRRHGVDRAGQDGGRIEDRDLP
jgi:hypothetical protein